MVRRFPQIALLFLFLPVESLWANAELNLPTASEHYENFDAALARHDLKNAGLV